ncbi:MULTISPECIES: YitT family protein [Paraliobacillus]|uniref:YczE/YyaS/YitT family protein n=1 Tax=Paraliobacillus TaxID=200903 RepID=UPI000DD4ED4B|nr:MULTISPECIES: membrane protein [Paraliobacillus]
MKSFKVRSIFFLVGIVILSFGISMTIKADLGAGAWDALNVGLSSVIGLTVGSWVIIIGLLLMLVNAWIVRERPDYFAIITILVIGLMIDFWLLIVMESWNFSGLIEQLFLLLIGISVLGFGVSIYLQPKFSLNPVDGFMVALKKRFHLSTMVAKTLTEATALVIAFLIGGPIGVGTFIILFGVGPAIQLFEPTANRMATYLDNGQKTI